MTTRPSRPTSRPWPAAGIGSSRPWKPCLDARCRRGTAASDDRAAARPVIAVLDFANVSADREFAWLSSGIAETVTNDLRLAGTPSHHRSPAPRGSGAACRHGPLRASQRAAHRPGRGRRASSASGERLRITARAVDARSGESLADAKADGPLEQVFDLQDRIVARFVDTLGAASRRRAGEAGAAGDEQPRGLPGLHGGTHPARIARGVAGTGGHRGLRAGDRPGSPLRAGPRRAGHGAVLAIRDVARAQPAGRGAPGPRHRSGPPRHRARRAIWPRPTRRCRTCWSAPAASTRRRARRGAPSPSIPATGGTTSASATPSGVRIGCGRSRGPWSSTRTSRSRTSRWPWCTSRAAPSIARSPCSAKARSCRTGRPTCASASPRRACTGCWGWCVSPRDIPRRRGRSSSGRSPAAPPSSTRRSSP